jgi:hypothetical protein
MYCLFKTGEQTGICIENWDTVCLYAFIYLHIISQVCTKEQTNKAKQEQTTNYSIILKAPVKLNDVFIS